MSRDNSDMYKSLPSLRRNDKYYLNGGDLFLLAGQDVFRIHRYFFERDSEYWAGKLQPGVAPGSEPLGTSDSNAIVLEGVNGNDLATFLWVFYNPKYSLYNATVTDWSIILSLATFWVFREAKSLAIRELEKLWMEDIDRVVLYHDNNVDRSLLIPRYVALADRPEPLNIEEGSRLGLETSLTLARAREMARSMSMNGSRGATSPSGLKDDELSGIIQELFSVRPLSRGTESPPQGERTSTSTLYSDAQLGRGLTSVRQATPQEPPRITPIHHTPLSHTRPMQTPAGTPSPLRQAKTPWPAPPPKTPQTFSTPPPSPHRPVRQQTHPTTPSRPTVATTPPTTPLKNQRAAQEPQAEKKPPPPPPPPTATTKGGRKRKGGKGKVVVEEEERQDEEGGGGEGEGEGTQIPEWNFEDNSAKDVVPPSATKSPNANTFDSQSPPGNNTFDDTAQEPSHPAGQPEAGFRFDVETPTDLNHSATWQEDEVQVGPDGPDGTAQSEMPTSEEPLGSGNVEGDGEKLDGAGGEGETGSGNQEEDKTRDLFDFKGDDADDTTWAKA